MAKRLVALTAVLALAGAACSRGTDLEKVPVGSDVQLTREDGGVVEGKLTARDEETVKVDVGRDHQVGLEEGHRGRRVVDPNDKPVGLPPIAKFREYTIPAARRSQFASARRSARRRARSATPSLRRLPIR